MTWKLCCKFVQNKLLQYNINSIKQKVNSLFPQFSNLILLYFLNWHTFRFMKHFFYNYQYESIFCWHRSSYSNILRDNKILKNNNTYTVEKQGVPYEALWILKRKCSTRKLHSFVFYKPCTSVQSLIPAFVHLKFCYVVCGGLAHKQHSHTRWCISNIK